MDAINKILADYYWIFLIVGIVILIFLIRFLIVNKKKTKAQGNAKQTKEASVPVINEPVKVMPQQPVIQQATQMVSTVPVQAYSEPTLDSLESSASEVNLGFNQNDNGMSMSEDGPMLVIEDTSAKNEEFGLVIEDPNTKTEEVSLVIEDPNLNQVQTITSEPSIFEAAPAPVNAPVVENAPVENSIFEVAPAVPVVQEPSVVGQTPTTVATQPVVQSVVETPVAMPVQAVAQPVAVGVTPVTPVQQVTAPSVPVASVQTQVVQPQTASVPVVSAPVTAPVETMETLDL